MSKILHKSDFEPYVKQTFLVKTETSATFEVELVEISDNSNSEIESFSLIFRGPKEYILPQSIYKITNEKKGNFELFLVPINSNKNDGTYYQSVFNRLVEN